MEFLSTFSSILAMISILGALAAMMMGGQQQEQPPISTTFLLNRKVLRKLKLALEWMVKTCGTGGGGQNLRVRAVCSMGVLSLVIVDENGKIAEIRVNGKGPSHPHRVSSLIDLPSLKKAVDNIDGSGMLLVFDSGRGRPTNGYTTAFQANTNTYRIVFGTTGLTIEHGFNPFPESETPYLRISAKRLIQAVEQAGRLLPAKARTVDSRDDWSKVLLLFMGDRLEISLDPVYGDENGLPMVFNIPEGSFKLHRTAEDLRWNVIQTGFRFYLNFFQITQYFALFAATLKKCNDEDEEKQEEEAEEAEEAEEEEAEEAEEEEEEAEEAEEEEEAEAAEAAEEEAEEPEEPEEEEAAEEEEEEEKEEEEEEEEKQKQKQKKEKEEEETSFIINLSSIFFETGCDISVSKELRYHNYLGENKRSFYFAPQPAEW